MDPVGSGGQVEKTAMANRFHWKPFWSQTREDLLGLIYPRVCQLCLEEEARPEDGYVGSACLRGLKYLRPPFCHRCGLPFPGDITHAFECANCQEVDLSFESVRSAVLAQGVAREILHRFKYGQARWFETLLGRLLVDAARPALLGKGWDFLVPVPLHPVKEREREFNQAERLARHLSQSVGIPVRSDLVLRKSSTPTQTQLTRKQRAENVRKAFQRIEGRDISGAAVVVVDDVLTTGATTDAVARQLRRLGASRVCVWTVARATLD